MNIKFSSKNSLYYVDVFLGKLSVIELKISSFPNSRVHVITRKGGRLSHIKTSKDDYSGWLTKLGPA